MKLCNTNYVSIPRILLLKTYCLFIFYILPHTKSLCSFNFCGVRHPSNPKVNRLKLGFFQAIPDLGKCPPEAHRLLGQELLEVSNTNLDTKKVWPIESSIVTIFLYELKKPKKTSSTTYSPQLCENAWRSRCPLFASMCGHDLKRAPFVLTKNVLWTNLTAY